MKYTISFFLFVFCITQQLYSQQYFYDNNFYNNPVTFEAGISIGPMNSLTDLGGRTGKGQRGPKDLNIKSTTLYGSIYVSTVYKNILAFRLEGTIGSVKSHDSLLVNAKNNGSIGRYNRNLSFKSPIDEISLTAELHVLDLFRPFDPESFPSAFSPYLIGGIGYFHFDPQALLNSTWINLQPLHTEGEGFPEYPKSKEYKLNQINIPLGAGIRYELSSKFNLRLEYINRVLFTDYLDDVHGTYVDPSVFSKYLNGAALTDALTLNNRVRSDAVPNLTTARPFGRRGNPLNNDSYFTINLKVGFVFGRESSGSGYGNGAGGGGGGGRTERANRRAQKRQLSCPKLF
jgi:hypothetical protein